MNKVIKTDSTKAQLQEYHKELIHREQQERKDQCILLTLALAGLVGVYVLVLNGVEQNSFTKSAPVEIEHDNDQSAKAADVSAFR